MSHSHNLTGEHVLRSVYDDDTQAFRTVLQPIELGMELNHADGDSVLSYKGMLAQELTSGTAIDLSSYSSFTCYFKYNASTSVTIEVSPTADGPFFELLSYTPTADRMDHKELNVARIKATFTSGQFFINART